MCKSWKKYSHHKKKRLEVKCPCVCTYGTKRLKWCLLDCVQSGLSHFPQRRFSATLCCVVEPYLLNYSPIYWIEPLNSQVWTPTAPFKSLKDQRCDFIQFFSPLHPGCSSHSRAVAPMWPIRGFPKLWFSPQGVRADYTLWCIKAMAGCDLYHFLRRKCSLALLVIFVSLANAFLKGGKK